MANTIKVKRGSGVPSGSDLEHYELGYRTGTTELYINDGDNYRQIGGAGGGGDITAVVAGTGLSGGATSGSATLNIDSTVATLTGSQTLTNKTLASPTFTGDVTFNDASTPQLNITDTTNTVSLRLAASDTLGTVGTTTDHNLNIIRNNVGKLTFYDTYTMHNNGGNDLDFRAKDSSGNVVFKVDAGTSKTEISTLLLDSVSVSAIQSSGESFADNDTSLMTSAAINDRIESFGYITTDTNTTYSAGTGLDLSGTTFSVDVSDFMTNGSNNRVLTATGTDGINAESNLMFNGSLLTNTGDIKINAGSLGVNTNAPSGDGRIRATSYITAGYGTGGVALTHNDGYGNANVTFNHEAGIPEQNGQSARIEVNTDATSNEGQMHFEVSSADVTSGSAVSLTNAMTLAHDYLEIPYRLRHKGDTDTYIQYDANRIYLVAGGTTKYDSNNGNVIATGDILDENDMASNSDTAVASQQSIKAYVDAEVAGIVDSAPSALNTLDELAAALGDDANFATTTSTSLGNRLRVDTASQGLTGTQQANAITNLGITATKAELNYVDGVTSNIQTQLDAKIEATLTTEQVQDIAGGMFSSNTETGIAATYQDGDGTIDLTVDYLPATDDRDVKPNAITTSGVKQVRAYFTTLEGLTGSSGSDYQDLLVLDTYSDGTGGDMNALAFDKSTQNIYHYLADQSDSTWGTAKRIAYIENGSNNRVMTASSSSTVNGESNLTFDGSTLALDGVLTVTEGSGTNTVVNLNGSAATFLEKDTGTEFYIANNAQDKDIILRVNDGGSNKTAIRIDASETGRVKLPNDNQRFVFGAGDDFQMFHDGTNTSLENLTGALYITNHADDQDIIFRIDDGGAGASELMRLDASTSRVGIGTSSPAGHLHINTESAEATKVYIDGEGSQDKLLFFRHQGNSEAAGTNYNGYIGSKVDNVLTLGHLDSSGSDIQILHLTEGGSVGIGTTSPSVKLQVADTSTHCFIRVKGGTGSYAGIDFGDSDDDDISRIRHNNSDNSLGLYTNNTLQATFTSAGNLILEQELFLKDDKDLVLGNGSDLQLKHDGSNSYIKNATGDLYIQNTADDKDIVLQSDDGSGGVENYMQIDGSAGRTLFNKPIRVNDDVEVQVGSAADLKFYHNATNSFIDNATGNLYIRNNQDDGQIIFQTDNGSGGYTTYFNIKGNDGISRFLKNVRANDSIQFQVGSSNDANFKHDGSNTYLVNNTGDLIISNTADDKDVILKSDDGSGGTTAYLTLDGSANKIIANENIDIVTSSDEMMRFKRSGADEVSIEQDSSQLYFYNRTTSKVLFLMSETGSAKVGYNTNPVFEIRNTGTSAGNGGSLTFGHNQDSSTTAMARISGYLADGSAAGRAGHLRFWTSRAGSDELAMQLQNDNKLRLYQPGDTSDYGEMYVDDTRVHFHAASGNYHRFTTDSGYIELGPANSGWGHLNTDRDKFYFNKPITVDGGNIDTYDEDMHLRRAGSNDDKIVIYASDTRIYGDADERMRIGSIVRCYKPFYVKTTSSSAEMRFYHEDGTGNIADSFADTTTDKSYINFQAGDSSNDPGYIMHETSDSETNEGVIHICPSDDNADSDYVSIHGTNDADKLKLHTSGRISGCSVIQVADGSAGTPSISNEDDNNTGMYFPASDNIGFSVNGGEVVRIDGSGLGVGITPAETLDLKTSSGDCRIRLDAPDGSDTEIKFFNAGSAVFTIGHDDGTGRFVIGTTNVDNAKVTFDTSGNLYATADVVAYASSDKRLKDNLKVIENPLDKISKLSGYEFDWNDKQETYQGHDVGVVAQEVEEVMPEVVEDREDGYKAVKYEKLIPLLIESIKELKEEINGLKAKLGE